MSRLVDETMWDMYSNFTSYYFRIWWRCVLYLVVWFHMLLLILQGCDGWFSYCLKVLVCHIVKVWIGLLAGNASVMEDDGSPIMMLVRCLRWESTGFGSELVAGVSFPQWLSILRVRFRLLMNMVRGIESILLDWRNVVKISEVLLFADR